MSTPAAPQAPLTPQEQQTIARLLSDPFYFPLQFKTWLQWLIEGGEGGIAGGGAPGGGGGGAGVPVGGIYYWTTPTLPANGLWANGAAISRVGYNTLFQVLGTRYGAGDGSTTFNIPDVEGRVIVCQAQTGGHADVSVLGANDGQPRLNRRNKHRTSNALTTAAHSHGTLTAGDSFQVGQAVNGPFSSNGAGPGNMSTAALDAATAAATVGITGSIGTNNGNDALDTPSFIVLPAVIRYI